MAGQTMVALASLAMGTRFELVLWGDDEGGLRAAGQEALGEIARLEAQLSLYRTDSDVSELNAHAFERAVKVDPRLFRLLERARTLSALTDGAFDITVAPLMRCWGFVGGSGRMPSPEDIAEARACVGMEHVVLDEEDFTVRFDRPGVMLDFGSLGKGYAVDCAVELLRQNGVDSALLHGGTSAVYAIGAPPDSDAWNIAVRRPFAEEREDYLAHVPLKNAALSVSAPHGKYFEAGGRRYGHVIDPRTGCPTGETLLASLVTSSATDGDALSTALLTLGKDWLPALAALYPDARSLIAYEDGEGNTAVVSQF